MKLSRSFITPLITIIFLVVALSGLLMFFHIFDGYTEVVHEILGVVFVVFSVLHVILNWKALKIHFKKRVFILSIIVVAVISILLVIQQQKSPKFDTILIERITNAPIEDVLKVLQVDSIVVVKRLEENGISFIEGASMKEIWINNKVSPKKLFDLIIE
jgi:Na+/melibiose symporter-like transporter